MREVGPLTQPDGCPDWVYIMMHQCWTFDPIQRPPFIAILDCLSSRYDMYNLKKNKKQKSSFIYRTVLT